MFCFDVVILHDDVIKWKHFPRYWPFARGIHRSPVNSPHKGQWRGALMFSLICVWINGWLNNREAGDLRRHCAHYGVTVMLGLRNIFAHILQGCSHWTSVHWGRNGLDMINSFPPNAACMRKSTGSALVQVMAYRRFGAKSLREPVKNYCQFDPWEQTSVKFESKYKTFHS